MNVSKDLFVKLGYEDKKLLNMFCLIMKLIHLKK